MSLSAHCLSPQINARGYLDGDNIAFISQAVSQELAKEFRQTIRVDLASIKRVMLRVYDEMVETVPQMNERVIMELCSEFRQYQADVKKKLAWEENYPATQLLYNPVGKIAQVDVRSIKLHHGVGGTRGFVFI